MTQANVAINNGPTCPSNIDIDTVIIGIEPNNSLVYGLKLVQVMDQQLYI